MTDAEKEARRQYYADWRRNNPDKVKAAKERFWAKKAAQAQGPQAKRGRKPKTKAAN